MPKYFPREFLRFTISVFLSKLFFFHSFHTFPLNSYLFYLVSLVCRCWQEFLKCSFFSKSEKIFFFLNPKSLRLLDRLCLLWLCAWLHEQSAYFYFLLLLILSVEEVLLLLISRFESTVLSFSSLFPATRCT